VLWRGRHAQEKAAGETEGGQEEDAPVREGGDSAGGVYFGVEDGFMIPRLPQTCARIGAGMTVFGMLVWLLWPTNFDFISQPEPIFGLVVAVFVWIATEIKLSEEVQLRASSPNDIRLARMLLQYHAEQFRIILKDHDFHGPIVPRYVSEIGSFLTQLESQHLSFQKKRLKPDFDLFIGSLEVFRSKVANYTVPHSFGGRFLTSVRGPHEMNDYDISTIHKNEISELNTLGSKAWANLDSLASRIKESVPESLDTPLEITWISEDHYSKL
jgi:hypothetical protein